MITDGAARRRALRGGGNNRNNKLGTHDKVYKSGLFVVDSIQEANFCELHSESFPEEINISNDFWLSESKKT